MSSWAWLLIAAATVVLSWTLLVVCANLRSEPNHRCRDALDADVVGDLRAFLGWGRRADEAAAFATLRDRWVVAGVRQGDDGRIVSQRTWLWGERTRRWALVLDFAAAGAAMRVPQPVGSVVDDELTLHPGGDPPRGADDRPPRAQ